MITDADRFLARKTAEWIGYKFRPDSGVEMEELIGDAMLSLVENIRVWDENRQLRKRWTRERFLRVTVRRDVIDALRKREGRGLQRLTVRQQAIEWGAASPSGRRYDEIVADPRQDTELQAILRAEGFQREPEKLPLTMRERIGVYLASIGRTAREEADELGLSRETVISTRKRVFIKLDAKNITHAVAIAYRRGLIE